MTKRHSPANRDELRRRAEERIGQLSKKLEPASQRLVHELRVHQIEIELQNEELQRSRAEVELSLARYTDLYDFAPVGYFTLDRAGAIVHVNLTGARLLGLERSRLLGNRFTTRVATDSRPAFEAFLQQTFDGRTKVVSESVVRSEGGAMLVLELTATAAPDGQECRVVATDITARKRAEELVALRMQLRELAVTHSIEELLQRALDEAERLTASECGFYHFVEAERHALLLQAWSTRTVARGSTTQDRGRLIDVDKAGVWAECLLRRRAVVCNDAAPLQQGSELPNGHVRLTRELLVPVVRGAAVVAIMGVGNARADFTPEDVNTVAYVADVAWELVERKRAERAREELQAQLAQAQKMDAIGTLAGGVAHDFNNILHGILGGLSMLQLNATGEDRVYIHEMMAFVKRGADLSRQLLGFARRGKYVVEPLELRPVLELTSGMFGRTRTDVPIELEVAPGLRRVLMDQTQLEQVLMNLFVNAGQAMPDGGRLCLRADDTVLAKETAKLHSVEPGPFVRLIVADTGVGMDATTQARIFEPFFTTRGPGRGPGLGLAAVYGIVHSHGGFITVESQPKRGTSFTLFLPAVEAEVEGATREAQGSQPGFTLRSSSKLHRPTT